MLLNTSEVHEDVEREFTKNSILRIIPYFT